MENLHFVEFGEYCEKCVYKKLSEDQSPCDECLEIGARPDSRKPEFFEEKK